jgi:hypothetical protein
MKRFTLTAALIAAFACIAPAHAQEKKVTIPAGTMMLVKLDKAVSSSDKAGTKFSGVLQADLVGDGVSAIKAGTAVFGTVHESKKARRVVGKASVAYALDSVRIDGQLVPIVTEPIEDVAKGAGRKTAKGAAVGAGVGAIAGDSDDAKKGAAIGAGVSALKKGESAGNAAGDLVEFRMNAPLTVTVK